MKQTSALGLSVWRGAVLSSLAATLVCALPSARAAPPASSSAVAGLRGADGLGALVPVPDQPPLYASDFASVPYGRAPDGWTALGVVRPTRNWAVDGQAFLRLMLKGHAGIIAYAGALADGSAADALGDVTIDAAFRKVEDDHVFFGLATRVQDASHFYTARLVGVDRLELHKVVDGTPALLGRLVTLRRYREGEIWRMALAAKGPLIAAAVMDAEGVEVARVEGNDEQFKQGRVGLNCTTYAAAQSFAIRAPSPYRATMPPDEIARRNQSIGTGGPEYPVVKPVDKVDALNTPPAKLAGQYDVIVAGAGTGGTAAAIQAARMGCKVLLLEETDWIGGQMAAVPTMDEGLGKNTPVRERGFYRELLESMASYYYTLDKDPYKGERSYQDPQTEAGFEPRIARGVLYGLIAEARTHGNTLDVATQSRVAAVRRDGDRVTGVTVAIGVDPSAARKREIACRVLIDATEYGDVIPLTGARYRAGNVTSDKLDPAAPTQDHTWPVVFREYPGGVPEHLRVASPPPGYETIRRPYSKYFRWGSMVWGKGAEGLKEFQYPLMLFYRANADTDSTLTGRRSEIRITQAEINGGNDYPATVATLENPAQRLIDERDGIYRTLSAVYYFQHELGLNWAPAEDEGFNTAYNQHWMKRRDLRPDLEKVAVYLPQQPYVRESRRIIGISTLVAHDLTRGDAAKLMPTSLAMGDYFMDLHSSEEHLEHDLDKPGYPKGGGTFQVPFESFIPEKLDGFVPAEKNLSQSRLVSGATRMQPSTMLTGQAAGTIAGLAVKRNVQPRQLDPKQVQAAQLANGSTLVQRWYSDVPWGTPIWRATQLLTLYQVMDRPGPFARNTPLGSKSKWGVDRPLSKDERAKAVARLKELKPSSAGAIEKFPARIAAGEFALAAAKVLVEDEP